MNELLTAWKQEMLAHLKRLVLYQTALVMTIFTWPIIDWLNRRFISKSHMLCFGKDMKPSTSCPMDTLWTMFVVCQKRSKLNIQSFPQLCPAPLIFTANMPPPFFRPVFSKFFGRRCLVEGLVSAPALPLLPPKKLSTPGPKIWQGSQINLLL